MDDIEQPSVSRWIEELKDGESAAAQKLWDHYSGELIRLARRQLHGAPQRVADEEDVVASVFESIFLGAQQGRFQDLHGRDELWWLLVTITKQKAVSHRRHANRLKRGGGRVRAETDLGGDESIRIQDLISDGPTPDFVVSLNEEHDRLLGLLRNDQLRQIASLRIQGYLVKEIAEQIGIAQRSVIRKLNLIRRHWAGELPSIVEE